MSFFKNKIGFSIVELVIVLALSFVLTSVVVGVFNQRRQVSDDDASKQIASEIQKITNEAKKSLGPTSQDENNMFGSGDILYGQAIGFNNSGCPNISGACLYVYKIAKRSTGQFFVYSTYQVKLPQGMYFNLITPTSGNTCDSDFVSCYKTPSGSLQNLYATPINGANGDPIGIVILNGSGSAYAYRGGNNSDALTTGQNTPDRQDRQGNLRVAISNTMPSGSLLTQSVWNLTQNKYYLNIDLASNSVSVQKL